MSLKPDKNDKHLTIQQVSDTKKEIELYLDGQIEQLADIIIDILLKNENENTNVKDLIGETITRKHHAAIQRGNNKK